MLLHDNADALLRALTAPKRNQFFYGKRMDVQHFRMEQDYGKSKQWLLNRLTQGKGVLCGLRVSMSADRIVVDPGVAIDGLGREIVVPVRTSIEAPASRAPDRARDNAAPIGAPSPSGPDAGNGNGLFTLWLCYRECSADYQPVLVSECDTRDQCAAGTVVETFCLKTTPGLPPLLGDPAWCARTRRRKTEPADEGSAPEGTGRRDAEHGAATTFIEALGSHEALQAAGVSAADVRATLASYRHTLCELFDGPCDPDDADPCVPLAAFAMSDGRIIGIESCLVRPRIYSNAVLLDLILCLAHRIDECCDSATAPMRVAVIDFLARSGEADAVVVASVASPLVETLVDLEARAVAIRIRFSRPFSQDAHKPTTPEPNDPDFKRHNVQVIPETVLNGIPYVPGSLTIEAPDTVRFDLFADSPYSIHGSGWQKGRYRLFLRGTADPQNNRPELRDRSGAPLDGEPIAPSAAAISGDGTAGGDFTATFTVR